MAFRRFMAIHTYHFKEAKKAMMQWAAENTSSQKEFMAAQVFNKCRTVATWIGSDDFFSVIGLQKQMKRYTTH